MWLAIMKFIGGPVVSGLIDAYKLHLTATTTDKQTAANLAGQEIASETRDNEIAASVVIAEQGKWYTAAVRPLMALPFVVFTWKVIVVDKVFGAGVTDALDDKMWGVFQIVVAAYFGGRTIEKVATILKSR